MSTTPTANTTGKPSLLEMTAVSLEQRRRLLAEVEQRQAAAAAQLTAAEAEHAARALARDNAMAASSAARDDDKLAVAAARENVRLEHAKADLGKARSDLEAVDDERRNTAAAVHGLQIVVWREQHRGAIFADKVYQDAVDTANKVVGGVVGIINALQAMRRSLEAHNKTVDTFHALGGEIDLRPLDGTIVAGEMMRVLHGDGCGIGESTNVNDLRFAVDLPAGVNDPIFNINEAARRTIAYVLSSIDCAERDRAHGLAVRGREVLADLVTVSTRSRERVEADQKLTELHRSRGEAREAIHRREHELRRQKAAEENAREQRHRGRGRRADGSVIGPPSYEPPEPIEPAEHVEPSDLTVG